MFINLPEGVKHHVRADPMLPFEVSDKGGLQKYRGLKSQFMSQNRAKINNVAKNR